VLPAAATQLEGTSPGGYSVARACRGREMAEPTFRTVPILRIFDVAKAKEFYVGFLGLQVDWEHRFGPDAPVYTQVSRGDLVLHLSEHQVREPGGTSAPSPTPAFPHVSAIKDVQQRFRCCLCRGCDLRM
jgi:Glyoxalase superfamily protein